MHFSSLFALSALSAVPAVQAIWEHHITVGKNGRNGFEPPFIAAKVGAKIKFEFFPKNHSVTQSPFDTPCTPQPWGIDSGFMPVAPGEQTKWFEFEVKDDKPIWFHCRQGTHCSKDGMVFAVNAVANSGKDFGAFQQLAKKQKQEGAAPPPAQATFCPAASNSGVALKLETENDIGGTTCTFNNNVCSYFANGSFSSGNSDCPTTIGARQGGGNNGGNNAGGNDGVCPAKDVAGDALSTEDGNELNGTTCTYGQKRCSYFSNGTFSSGGSDCPITIPATSGGGSSALAGSASVNSVSGALEGDDSSSGGSPLLSNQVVLGLLAANIFLSLILVVMSILSHVRKGGREVSRKGVYEPVKEPLSGHGWKE